jgi:hypothetical protein
VARKPKEPAGRRRTEVNVRTESAVASEFDIAWSVALWGCDFFAGGNLRAICSRRRGTNDEWPVKVFNSSVENRVEKLCCK